MESRFESSMDDMMEAVAGKEEQDLHRHEILAISQKIKQLNDLFIKSKRLGNRMYMDRIRERIAILTDQRNQMRSVLDQRQALGEVTDDIFESVNHAYRMFCM